MEEEENLSQTIYSDSEVIEPEVVKQQYAAPFQSEIGKSSVDLTEKKNQDIY